MVKSSLFQRKVWRKTKSIPRGRVITYAVLARAVGKPRAARAVGNALHSNPYRTTPCHRVVLSDGRVGGYLGGIHKKIDVLKNEGVEIFRGRVKPRYILSRLSR